MSMSGADDAALIERLRGEAVRSRPAFDAAAAARVIAAVRGDASVGRIRCVRMLKSAVVVIACLAAAWGGVGSWGERGRLRDGTDGGSGSVAVDAPMAGLDALPTLDEVGAGVADGIGSLAATVVGLPDWRELAVADLPIVDAWRFDHGAGVAAGSDGSDGPGPTR